MLELTIPGHQDLSLENLVLDYNGVLACDGQVLPGVREALEDLASSLHIDVLTADTFGSARSNLDGYPCELAVLPAGRQDEAKLAHVERLGAHQTVCIGNGRNDRFMLKAAALGIVVVQQEGAAVETLLAADVACPDILAALQLLRSPLRLRATLRS